MRTLEEPIPESDLKKELEKLSNDLYANSHIKLVRYFHLKSVNNFIYHLDEVQPKQDQLWIYYSLKDYLEDAAKGNKYISRNLGAQLFHTYLEKIAAYYSSRHGFSLVISPVYTTMFYFILFLACYFIFNIWISLIPIGIYIVQMIRVTKKYRTRRVYGLFY